MIPFFTLEKKRIRSKSAPKGGIKGVVMQLRFYTEILGDAAIVNTNEQ
jgi:hypothetical protein